MAHLTLSPADKKLLNEVFDDDVIDKQAAPWFRDALGSIQNLAKTYDEITYRGRHVMNAVGFSADRTLQHVARFPDAMTVAAIIEVDPEILNNEKKLLAFLDTPAGQKFDLRRRHRK